MTNGKARDTAPAVRSFTLQRAPFPPPSCPALGRAIRPPASPNFPIITSNCPSPTPLRLRQAEPTPSRGILPPSQPSFLPPSNPLPPPLTVGDWARPSWLLRCRPPPPPLLPTPGPLSRHRRRGDSPGAAPAPAQSGVPGPSRVARACAALAGASSSVPVAPTPSIPGG